MGGVIFKRRKGTDNLTKIAVRPFEATHSEADLHRFLEAEPSLIARGITEGEPIPTVVVASHLDLGTGELDLLLLDAEGEITVAELKRGRTPREIVAQVLDYASQVQVLGLKGLAEVGADWESALERLGQADENAGNLGLDAVRLALQNPRLLIVAFEIDETTRRITEYLRGRGLPVYCIEFEYFADEEYEYYYPEVIGAEDVKRIESQEETASQRAYRVIWRELLASFKSQRPGVTRRDETDDSWCQVPIGIANAHLEWSIHGLNRDGGWFEVGIHFEHSDRHRNTAAIRLIEQHRTELESLLGEPLHFEELWGRKWARVYVRRDAPFLDDETKNWALQTMIRFNDAVAKLSILEGLRGQGW